MESGVLTDNIIIERPSGGLAGVFFCKFFSLEGRSTIPAGRGNDASALQRRNLLFFWQEGPREARRIEPKKTKEDAKRARRRACSTGPLFWFFSFLSARVI
jgi:hypothetical protein